MQASFGWGPWYKFLMNFVECSCIQGGCVMLRIQAQLDADVGC